MGDLLLAIVAVLIPAVLAGRRGGADNAGNNAGENDAAQAELIRRVDDLLPQTQCGECGYAACRPYAEALVRDGASLDLCPPGGNRTRHGLARLLGRAPIHADNTVPAPTVARIDPRACIGCVKCIRACPVDAIVGARGQLHAVIPELCTGCELCLPPCPVDCIAMETPPRRQWKNPARSRWQT